MEKYCVVIINQLQHGNGREVPSNDLSKPSHSLRFMERWKEGNDIRIRWVYNGSARLVGWSSPNGILCPEPLLLPNLITILLRARFQKISISSGIEKAFLMVALNGDCGDYTCFLWQRNFLKPLRIDIVATYRFTHMLFGLACSLFLSLKVVLWRGGLYSSFRMERKRSKGFFCSGSSPSGWSFLLPFFL